MAVIAGAVALVVVILWARTTGREPTDSETGGAAQGARGVASQGLSLVPVVTSGLRDRTSSEPPGPETRDAPDSPAPADSAAFAPNESPSQPSPPGVPSDLELVELARRDDVDGMSAFFELARRDRRDLMIPLMDDYLRRGSSSLITRATMQYLRWDEPLPFNRSINDNPERPRDSTEAIELTLELRGDLLEVGWHLWFGPDVFAEDLYAPSYTISVRGGTLAEEIKVKRTPSPGDNHGREVVASGAGPGAYTASVFLWCQQPDQVQLSNNGPFVQVERR